MTYFSIRQSVDDHTKGRQTLVDLLRLLQSLPASSRLSDLFGTGQIDQEEVSVLRRTGLSVTLLDRDDEDRMGS